MPTTVTTARDMRAEMQEISRRLHVMTQDASNEDRGLTSEEVEERNRLIDRHDELEARATMLEQDAEREAASLIVARDPELVPGAFAPQQPARASGEYEQVFETFIRHGAGFLDRSERALLQGRIATLSNGERAALGATGAGSAGGYAVPTGFLNRLVESMAFVGGMREVASQFTTATGEDLPFPTSDDTGNEGAILGENTAISEQDPTFGTKTLRAYVYTSKLVRMSLQLLQDDRIDIEGRLAGMFARRIARIQNRHFTLGTGNGQPEGFVHVASVGKALATGQTTTFLWTDLVDLEHSIDRDYRSNARFMCSDGALQVAKKLLDGNSRPIWMAPIAGEPGSINGYQYTVNSHMAAPAASAKSVAFGDFSHYQIRDVEGGALVRLEERYAEYLQVGFFQFLRSDGILDDTAAIKVLQHAGS